MNKYYVLDTSVLLFDPKSLLSFENCHVVIPETVLKELDRKKNLSSVIGRNAREVIRTLKTLTDKCSLSSKNNILIGMPCEKHSGTVRIYNEEGLKIPTGLNSDDADNKILSVALSVLETVKSEDCQVFLVTKDTALELKAQVHSLSTYDYLGHSGSRYKGYTGIYIENDTKDAIIAKLFQEGHIKLPKKYQDNIHENGHILFKPLNDNSNEVLAQRKGSKLILCDDRYKLHAYNVLPKNDEQYFALSLLMDPDVDLVTINGSAGTGKTIVALAAALCQVDEASGRPYSKVMFARSLTPLGGKEQVGFLKGSLKDKLQPWIMPISDNINFIIDSPNDQIRSSTSRPYDTCQSLIDQGILEIVALQYIRGRSLVDTFVIIDECQNITKAEIYTIITRIGEGSKIVLIGDNLQVDAHYLSRDDNALVHVIEAFKDSKLAGHVTLVESVRSALAKEAAERLVN